MVLISGIMKQTEPHLEKFERFEKEAKQPSWVSFLNPFIGAAGVLASTKLRRSTTA